MTELFTGPNESGSITLVTADNDTPQTVVEIPDGALFKLERVLIEYSQDATADFDLTVYDDADGTVVGSVSDSRHKFIDIAPDEAIDREFAGMRYFEEDVLVGSDGTHDGDATITIQGKLLTTLTDVME